MKLYLYLLFCFFVICAQADSLLDLKSTEESKKINQHPLIYGFGKVFSHLHNDNFIDLGVSPTNNKDTYQNPYATEQDSVSSSKRTYTSKTDISKAYTGEKPKVLLIMDDLSSLSQVKKIEKLKLNITPSIFPKTKHNPHTPDIAAYLNKKDKTFMVHLPLEAKQFMQNELTPIKVGTHKEAIKTQLAEIKADFPHLVYINNHTGSKFTQSYDDMRNLLSVLDELDLKFVDSITTSSPVSERIAAEQGKLIMARDVFLDNETNVAYIKAQIQSLMKKAQKKGYAIAICHPNTSTFKALSQMRDNLIDSVELVSPQELESYLIRSKTTHYVRAPFNQ
ncbi:divergent polysaccharide deacetylase family protein [Helicobacter japonicus]|uniref:divergent polysaccharide deacetylase family protein n=1 Tax=Helicobacter japonicus TaxID=425400 RepID=UPI0005130C72|nr:divergent polysaccharide deacetylase family protein [Helicobacter japonicus]